MSKKLDQIREEFTAQETFLLQVKAFTDPELKAAGYRIYEKRMREIVLELTKEIYRLLEREQRPWYQKLYDAIFDRES